MSDPNVHLLELIHHTVVKEEDSCSTQSNIQPKFEIQDVKLEPISEELHLIDDDYAMVEEIKDTVREEDPWIMQSNIQLKSEPLDMKFEIPSDGDDTYLKLEPVGEELHLKDEDDLIVEKIEQPGRKAFQCKVCNNIYPYKSYLRRHMDRHIRKKLCDKKYTKKDFHKHARCNVFTYKSDLNQHMETHRGDKSFQYNIYDKKYTEKDFLKHMHTRENHVWCNVFTYKSDLNQHMKTHTRENFFQCKSDHTYARQNRNNI